MINNPDGSVTLTANEYESMQDKIDWLDCLEQAGVDNWEGFEYAIDIRREMYKE